MVEGTAQANDMAEALVARHFLEQHLRPAGLADVVLADLSPELRTLLFTDGTVTRALEAQTLQRVTVVVAEERVSPVPAELARCVDLPPGAETSRRRVTIRSDQDCALLAYAESLMVLDRLPSGFLALLKQSRQGLGEALNASGLESQRELLWFGLGSVPAWSPPGSPRPPALVRTYRIVIDEEPTVLITETFPLRRVAGVYDLLGT